MDTILNQYAPGDTAMHVLYTVPAGPKVGISAVNVANRAGANVRATVSIAREGEADAAVQVWQVVDVADGTPGSISVGIVLNPGAIIRGKASAAATFQVIGG